ncbi:MAG: vWA domain-containing protein [Pirellulales bacterium]
MNGVLPEWLARWFGVDAGGGHGVAWRLLEFWNWPTWVGVLAVIAAAVLVFTAYWHDVGAARRRTRLLMAGLRLATILLLLAMLARWMLALERTDLPTVIVVVDVSKSMDWPDGFESSESAAWKERLARLELDRPTRLNVAKSVLLDADEGLLDDLTRRYRVRLYQVADAAEASSAASVGDVRAEILAAGPRGEHSRLGDAVRTALDEQQGRAVAALVALTDGITTDGRTLSEAAADCRRRGAPLFAVALGSQRPPRDVELADLSSPDVVFAGDVVYFDGRLIVRGFAGKSVQVALRDADSQRVLAETSVAVAGDDEEHPIHLAWQPQEPGQFRLVVEAKPLDGEFNLSNNARSRTVTVVKQTIRVLLIDGRPRYEYRFLKHFLQREPSVEVRAVLADADRDLVRNDATMLAALPVRQDELFSYDVVILGDVDPTFLGPSFIGALRDFVEKRAGGLALVAGENFMPSAYAHTVLDPLIPVEIPATERGGVSRPFVDSFALSPTAAGMSFPQMRLAESSDENDRIWKSLAEQFWYYDAARLKGGALALADHPTQRGAVQAEPLPLIATLHATWPGKTLFHGFDGTYLWQHDAGGRYYARYWLQAIRYLAHTKLLGQDRRAELTTDRREYRRGATVELQLRFFAEQDAPGDDQPISVAIEGGDGRRTVVLRRLAGRASRFVGNVADLAEGNYAARLVSPPTEGLAPAADFVVLPPPGELDHVETDIAELTAATRNSSGKLYRADTAGSLVDDLPPGRHAATTRLPDVSLWNGWPVPILFLALLASEWILRKRHGML